MTIAVDHLEGPRPIAVISLAGELDASNYERLIATVQQTYDAGARGLVLDLADLTFMASSGLVALYSAARIFRGEPAPDTDAGWQVFHDMQDDAEDTPNIRLAGTQQAVDRPAGIGLGERQVGGQGHRRGSRLAPPQRHLQDGPRPLDADVLHQGGAVLGRRQLPLEQPVESGRGLFRARLGVADARRVSHRLAHPLEKRPVPAVPPPLGPGLLFFLRGGRNP